MGRGVQLNIASDSSDFVSRRQSIALVKETGMRSRFSRTVPQMSASRSGAGYGSARTRTPFTAVNADVASAKAMASVMIAVVVSIGVRRAARTA